MDMLLLHLLADLRAGSEIEVAGMHSTARSAIASRRQLTACTRCRSRSTSDISQRAPKTAAQALVASGVCAADAAQLRDRLLGERQLGAVAALAAAAGEVEEALALLQVVLMV